MLHSLRPSAWLPQLPAFVAVAEERSFTRAAKRLALSTSAVSQSVRALEATLGAPLFTRTTRSVAPTEAGQRLLSSCAPLLRALGDAVSSAAATAGEVSGTLRLSVPRIAVPALVPFVARAVERHPRVHIELVVDNRFVDIVAGGFDAGVRLVEAVQKDMVAVRMSPAFRFVVVGSPRYFAVRGVPRHPRDLKAHQVIGFVSPTTGGAPIPWDLEKRGRVWRVPASAPVSATDESVLIGAAREALGLAYVAETSVAADVDAGRLVRVLDDWAPEVPGLFLYFPSRAQRSPALAAFVRVIEEGRSAENAPRRGRRSAR